MSSDVCAHQVARRFAASARPPLMLRCLCWGFAGSVCLSDEGAGICFCFELRCEWREAHPLSVLASGVQLGVAFQPAALACSFVLHACTQAAAQAQHWQDCARLSELCQ